ncbi:uncharacterized protein LOC129587829 [Paramacrobiotus metropolitanus]|uniref:uncharacterized protein LOC129587829 n=1 Tax=Paramacrobiotus metropolitanus TaxID=2943436 RepID=UPI00244659A9|nr:uncharacterized protein LOC129587829 [Paramacrobiotus metropolitanus]
MFFRTVVVVLCLVAQAFAWYGNNFGGFGGFGGGYYGGNYGNNWGGSNANALGGASALWGNAATRNTAYTNSNPWGSSGYANNWSGASGLGANAFGAAMSNSNYGNNYGRWGGYYYRR